MHILTKPSETQGKEYILTDGCDGKGDEIFQIQTMHREFMMKFRKNCIRRNSNQEICLINFRLKS